LDVVHRNALVQVTLIDDLLDMSRVVRGALRLNMQPADLAVIVDAAVDALLPAAEARRIRLTVSAAQGSALVSGDQSRLQQIIFNVVSNSLKFTPPEGAIDVRLRIERDEAVLSIRDPARVSRLNFSPMSSNASDRRRRKGRGGNWASASGCPWSVTWWSSTEGPLPRRVRRKGAARRSPCGCRCSTRPHTRNRTPDAGRPVARDTALTYCRSCAR
jgi:hypothetical protein